MVEEPTMNETIKTKICTQCKNEQKLSCFHKNKAAKDGYRSQCKQCVRKYYTEKPMVTKEHYAKEYYANNRDIIKSKVRAYQKKNINTLNAKKREYNKTEIGRIISKNTKHKRRAITKQGDVTTNQLIELQKNAKVCYWCGISLKKVKGHIDHYEPLSKGGEHTLANLVVSCQKCNNQKHAKDPLEFASTLGKLL